MGLPHDWGQDVPLAAFGRLGDVLFFAIKTSSPVFPLATGRRERNVAICSRAQGPTMTVPVTRWYQTHDQRRRAGAAARGHGAEAVVRNLVRVRQSIRGNQADQH